MSSSQLLTLSVVNSAKDFQPLELPVEADAVQCASCAADRVVLATRDGLVFATKLAGDASTTEWKKPLEGCRFEPRVTQVGLGPSHYVALTSEQTVWTWGRNNQGQLGRELNSKCGKRKEKSGFFTPGTVARLEGVQVVHVACGRAHNVCLSDDGRVFTWGANDSGQLGDGSTTGKRLHEMNSLKNASVTLVCAGGAHSLALTATGRVFAWGSNGSGQLGLNSKNCRVLEPEKSDVPLGTIQSICCGEKHTAFLTRDGRILTCGEGTSGQLGHEGLGHVINPKQISELSGMAVSRIACGRNYTLALVDATKVLYIYGPVRKTVPLPPHLEPSSLLCGKEFLCIFSARTSGNCGAGISVYRPLTLDIVQDAMRHQTHEVKVLLKKALSSASCINGSFLDHTLCSKSSHAVNLLSAADFFQEIRKPEFHSIAVKALKELLETLPSSLTGAHEELRLYLILISCLYVDDQVFDSSLVSSLASCLLRLKDEGKEVLGGWIKGLPRHIFSRCVWVFKTAAIKAWRRLPVEGNWRDIDQFCERHQLKWMKGLSLNMILQSKNDIIAAVKMLEVNIARKEQDGRFFHLHDETAPSQEKTAMETCFEWMALLYEINESRQEPISFKNFYLTELSEMINIQLDFLQKMQDEGAHNLSYFRFCKYRFLYDVAAKLQLLKCECMLMQWLGEKNLKVRRCEVVQDSKEICDYSEEELRVRLVVTFYDESDYFGPGILHEYFRVLFDELLHPDFGVFHHEADSKSLWFEKGCCPDKIKFVGLMCGLALYNGATLHLQFPRVLYKKLLHKTVTLDDLSDLKQSYFDTMKRILEEETEDIGVDFTVPDVADHTKVVELKEDGEQTPVTQSNKKEYVEAAVNYYLNTSIDTEFQTFCQGFFSGIPEGFVSAFQPQELEEILEGNERYDFKALERVTEYGYDFHSQHEIIRLFWEVFHAMELEDQKKFLIFLTGTQKIPADGMEKMKMKIVPRDEPDKHPNALLPHVMTCFNRLFLPRYTGKEHLERNLLLAIRHCDRFDLPE